MTSSISDPSALTLNPSNVLGKCVLSDVCSSDLISFSKNCFNSFSTRKTKTDYRHYSFSYYQSTVNRPDEWANRAWKDWNAANLPVVSRSDWPIGAVDRLLVQLLTNTLEILVERPKVLIIVFMVAGGLKILNETLLQRTKLLDKKLISNAIWEWEKGTVRRVRFKENVEWQMCSGETYSKSTSDHYP